MSADEGVERPPGRVVAIDADGKPFSPLEQASATYLAAKGNDVVKLAERHEEPGRKCDALVNGVRTELKTFDSPNATSNRVVSALQRSIKAGGQARNVVIDARGSGLSRAEAGRAYRRLLPGLTKGRIDHVRIIGDAFDLSFAF